MVLENAIISQSKWNICHLRAGGHNCHSNPMATIFWLTVKSLFFFLCQRVHQTIKFRFNYSSTRLLKVNKVLCDHVISAQTISERFSLIYHRRSLLRTDTWQGQVELIMIQSKWIRKKKGMISCRKKSLQAQPMQKPRKLFNKWWPIFWVSLQIRPWG